MQFPGISAVAGRRPFYRRLRYRLGYGDNSAIEVAKNDISLADAGDILPVVENLAVLCLGWC